LIAERKRPEDSKERADSESTPRIARREGGQRKHPEDSKESRKKKAESSIHTK